MGLTFQEPWSSPSKGLRVGEEALMESSKALILAPFALGASFLSSFFTGKRFPLSGKRAESGIAMGKAIGMPDFASGMTIFWFVIALR